MHRSLQKGLKKLTTYSTSVMRSKLLKSSKQWRDLKGGGNKKMSETREEEAEDPRDEPAPIRTHSRGIPRPGAQSRSRNALTH